MNQIKIAVEGMTCGGCEASVARALERLPGVKSAKASHQAGEAVVAYDETQIAPEAICQTIDEVGFKAIRG